MASYNIVQQERGVKILIGSVSAWAFVFQEIDDDIIWVTLLQRLRKPCPRVDKYNALLLLKTNLQGALTRIMLNSLCKADLLWYFTRVLEVVHSFSKKHKYFID